MPFLELLQCYYSAGEAELLNFAVFSLIFEARKKIISASDRVIPCQDFLFLSDFWNFVMELRYLSSKLRAQSWCW